MKPCQTCLAVLLISFLCPPGFAGKVPFTPKKDASFQIHGETFHDPYLWLESPKERGSWLSEQKKYYSDHLAKNPSLGPLKSRLKGLFSQDYQSYTVIHGDKVFWTEQKKEQAGEIDYWVPLKDPNRKPPSALTLKEMKDQGFIEESVRKRVLFDLNDPRFLNRPLVGSVVSKSGSKVVYRVSKNNGDWTQVYVQDIETGISSEFQKEYRKLLGSSSIEAIDVLEGVNQHESIWTDDGLGFYYRFTPSEVVQGVRNPIWKDSEIRYHRLGTPQSEDQVVYKAPEGTNFYATLGAEGRQGEHQYLSLYELETGNIDYLYRKVDGTRLDSTTQFKKYVEVPYGRSHSFQFFEGRFYVVSTIDNEQGELLVQDSLFEGGAQRVYSPGAGQYLQWVEIVGGHLILGINEKATTVLEQRTLDGEFVRRVQVPGLESDYGVMSFDWGSARKDQFLFSYESPVSPLQVYRSSIAQGKVENIHLLDMDYGFDSKKYVSKQLTYRSKDGTQITMFLAHRRGIDLDGTHPTLLRGYGGFAYAEKPQFSGAHVPWLESGGILAVANLRGGGEYGPDWHEMGRLDQKQNVFDDFISAAETLIGRGYTNPSKLAILGESNGGLLTGASLVQRPDLFGAVIIGVPLLDMLRYEELGGSVWAGEYGSVSDPEMFKVLREYSPYRWALSQQSGVSYPSVLLWSAENDDRGTHPAHAHKMAAALQGSTLRNGARVLLKSQEGAGHGGGGSLSSFVEQYSEYFSFLFEELGMRPFSSLEQPR